VSLGDERIRVLKLVQSGQISAEEGARLLEALKSGAESAVEGETPVAGREPRLLRVRISDLETGSQKLEFKIPWNLVSVGLDMGARFAREEVRAEEFIKAVRSGQLGKIMEVVDEEDGERVEIFAE
jgi:hypothetical protein